jgi:S-(hydroxymethyl)glutathione dehydrogenase / alcohol dehydrogenase
LSAAAGRILSCPFPAVFGHEGAGIVESVGDGVTNFTIGDHVIPIFLPQCKNCHICSREGANFCLQFVGNQLKGLMLDGTSRMTCRGQKLFSFTGCSTLSEFSVISEINLCKINPLAPLEKVCLLSCGVTTGYGAAINCAKVQSGSTCAVWGLGALGLAAIMGCKKSGASRIIAIDLNPSKYEIAKEFGATEFLNPNDIENKTIQEHIREITNGGADYTFECVGSVLTMRQAFESAAFGYGVCVLIGVAPSLQEINLLPIDLQLGRTLKGTLFGDYKSVDSVPQLVEEYLDGKMNFDKMITHTMKLDSVNKAFDLLKKGESIRTVIIMDA